MMPRKMKVTIPKGTKCDNGEICDKDYEVTVDVPETKPSVEPVPTPKVDIPEINQGYQQQQVVQQAPPEPKDEERGYTTEELADLMPTGVNFAVCKGKNCADSIIKNKKFTTNFKKCPKCGCNNVPNNSTICPCCGKSPNEDEQEDYWDESEIELETEE